jgi:hypothetical protein
MNFFPTTEESLRLTRRALVTRFVLAAFACLAAAPAFAQAYYDYAGSPVQGFYPLPYQYIPLTPGQHAVTPTSSTALTLPALARYATICASNATVRYTTDGTTTPTAAIGQPLAAGACVSLSGAAVLANFRAISATGTLDVEYFK